MTEVRSRFSLRDKLLLVMTGVTGAALVLAGFVSVWLVRRSVVESTRDELVRQADALVDFIADPELGLPPSRDGQTPEERQVARAATFGAFTAVLRLVSQVESAEIFRVTPEGTLRQPERINVETDLLADFDQAGLDVEALLAGETQTGVIRSREGAVVWVAAGAGTRAERLVFVLSAAPETDRSIWRSPMLAAGLSALALAVGMSVWFANRLTRPLRRLQAAAGAIANGDLTARVEPTSGDEVGVLGETFNTMADELGRARQTERSFVMSVSHDLRTPLTSIKGYAEAIADGAVTGDAAVAAGQVIEAEAGRLERLVHDLLDLARLDASEFRLHVQSVDLDADLRELAASFARRADEAGLEFSVAGSPLPEIRTDPDRVAQVVANLLENSLRYTQEGRAISLTWTAASPQPDAWPRGAVRIDVSDTGDGIPPEHLPHVFERLYVAGHLPGARQVGTGLGLAIVAELTLALGGRATVDSTPGAGTTFSVWLPI
ncbi:MAG: HAMP domain-containing histidine kinase [Acidimicrobiia bacterium]|nr:HAMP domain-containing histidine kinase [Acidimicrobiia bacterium]